MRLMWDKVKRVPAAMRRFVGSGALAALVLLVGAPAAFAKGTGQAPRFLAWINLTDSHGIPLWNHELSIDQGGVMSSFGHVMSASTTSGLWGLYRSWVAFVLWFLDWVLSLQWLGVLTAPMLAISNALQTVVGKLGLTVAFLTITMLVAGWMMLRGRAATGLYEICVALLIASLATGVLLNPVKLVIGDDGYVANANKLGQEISTALNSTDGGASLSSEQARKQQVGTMVDVFVRQPLQMINYGQVLDGGKCEGAYDEAVKGGPYGEEESTIRDKIAACDPALGEVAASPNLAMALSAQAVMPAGTLLALLVLLVCGSVVAAGAWAVYQSLKGFWALLQATLPGANRSMLFSTVGGIVESLVTLIVANIFLGITMLVLKAVFGQPEMVGQRFVIADVVMAVAIVVWWRARKRMKAMGRNLAEWMSQRPGGSPTKITHGAHQQGSAGRAMASAGRLAMQAWQMKQMRNLANQNTTTNNALIVMGQPHSMPGNVGGSGYAYQTGDASPGAPALTAGVRGQLAAGSGGTDGFGGGPIPAGPGPSGSGTAAALPAGRGLARIEGRTRPKGVIQPLVKTAATVALAVGTGGTSTAVAGASKAAIVVRNARRAQLVARMSKQAVSGAGRALAGGRAAAGPALPAAGGAREAPVVTGRVLDAPRTPVVPDSPRPPQQRPLEPTRGPSPALERARNADMNAAKAAQFRQRLASRMRRAS